LGLEGIIAKWFVEIKLRDRSIDFSLCSGRTIRELPESLKSMLQNAEKGTD